MYIDFTSLFNDDEIMYLLDVFYTQCSTGIVSMICIEINLSIVSSIMFCISIKYYVTWRWINLDFKRF
jgi:hypothetical protein